MFELSYSNAHKKNKQLARGIKTVSNFHECMAGVGDREEQDSCSETGKFHWCCLYLHFLHQLQHKKPSIKGLVGFSSKLCPFFL